MNKLENADVVKALFIDYILINDTFCKDENFCIGQEVMYGLNKFSADLVILSKQKLYAIEIKAKHDNIKRLDEQLSNYTKLFDYVYLVVTKNHLPHLAKVNMENVGVYVIDDSIEKIKKARQNKVICKEYILETIPAKFLAKYFSIKMSGITAVSLRKILKEKSLKELKIALINYMQSKLLYRYQNFIADKGEIVHYEDVSILSIPNLKILK